jgi:hypothetical protein
MSFINIRSRRQDLQEAVSSALSVLNNKGDVTNKNKHRYVASDFVEGLYRLDVTTFQEHWFVRLESPR